MEITNVQMDHINDSTVNPRVAALDSFGQRGVAEGSSNPQQQSGDTFEADSARQYIRTLCESGEAELHIQEIIATGIEPDCLRAELAYQAAEGNMAAVSIIISYLAGDFKDALFKTQAYVESENEDKAAAFIFFANYLTGRFDKAYEQGKNLGGVFEFSPLACYAYSDILLSLGYIDETRIFNRRYINLARKHLVGFVSEKEKYDGNRNRQSLRGKQQNAGDKDKQKSSPEKQEEDSDKENENEKKDDTKVYTGMLNPRQFAALKVLFDRRKVLLTALKARDVSYDKRPLFFEFEDVDAKIARMTGNTPLADIY